MLLLRISYLCICMYCVFNYVCALTLTQSDKDSREDVNKVFNLFDDDNSGKISLRNLKRVAKELGETMSDAELLEMIERADADGGMFIY